MSNRIKKDRLKFAINRASSAISISARSDIDVELDKYDSDVFDDFDYDFENQSRNEDIIFHNAIEPTSGELFYNDFVIVIMINHSMAIIASDLDNESQITDLRQESNYYINNLRNERSEFRAKLDL